MKPKVWHLRKGFKGIRGDPNAMALSGFSAVCLATQIDAVDTERADRASKCVTGAARLVSRKVRQVEGAGRSDPTPI